MVAIQDFKRIPVQHKNRIRYIIEYGIILFLGFFQLFFQQFSLGNIDTHLHGGHDFAMLIFDGRCSDNPMGGSSILAKASLLAEMRQAVFKSFFYRTDFTFLLTAFIGVITVVARLGIEFFIKIPVVPHQFIVSILHRDNTGNQLEQALVFIALLVEFLLFFTDIFTHSANRRCQSADFVILIYG